MERGPKKNPESTEEFFDQLMSNLLSSMEVKSAELESTHNICRDNTDYDDNHEEQKPSLSVSNEKSTDCSSGMVGSFKLSSKMNNSATSDIGNHKSLSTNKADCTKSTESVLNSPNTPAVGRLKRSIYDRKNLRSKKRIVRKSINEEDISIISALSDSNYVVTPHDIVTNRRLIWIENTKACAKMKRSVNRRKSKDHPNPRPAKLLSESVQSLPSCSYTESSLSSSVQCDVLFPINEIHIAQFNYEDKDYSKITFEDLEKLYLCIDKVVHSDIRDQPSVYQCKICQDQFLFLNSFNNHLVRKVAEMVINCVVCGHFVKFHNFCVLKNHIMTHESNGIIFNKHSEVIMKRISAIGISPSHNSNLKKKSQCSECHCYYDSLESHLSEVKHSLDIDKKCRVCSYVSPSICGMRIHVRLHVGMPPYCCPDCGSKFPTKHSVLAHVKDICCHFEKSRSYICSYCGVLFDKINLFRSHIINLHNTLFYQCQNCSYSCRTLRGITEHSKVEHPGLPNKNLLFRLCQLCPNKRIPRTKYSSHITEHLTDPAAIRYIYKCKKCKLITSNKTQFLDHKLRPDCYSACQSLTNTKSFTSSRRSSSNLPSSNGNSKERTCSVVEDSGLTTNKISKEKSIDYNKKKGSIYKCCLCGTVINYVWSEVIKHYSGVHKIQDVKYLPRYIVETTVEKEEKLQKDYELNERKSLQKKPNEISKPNFSENINKTEKNCKNCSFTTTDIDSYRKHIVLHRTDPTLFQCLECAACFVVRSALEKHLIGIHGIDEVDEYIKMHDVCHKLREEKKPLLPNQCSVCMKKFDSPSFLSKHFRSHGMAFLNQMKKN